MEFCVDERLPLLVGIFIIKINELIGGFEGIFHAGFVFELSLYSVTVFVIGNFLSFLQGCLNTRTEGTVSCGKSTDFTILDNIRIFNRLGYLIEEKRVDLTCYKNGKIDNIDIDGIAKYWHAMQTPISELKNT